MDGKWRNAVDVNVFQTTHWTLVREAGGDDESARREALSQIIRRYTPALRHHLVTSLRIDPARTDDLIQGFLLKRVLVGNLIARARQERGRFRWFLCTALDRYVSNEFRRDRARKRRPEKSVSLDEGLIVADSSPSADASFDVEWARQLLSDAVEKMRQECARSGRADIWGVFEARLLGPTLDNAQPMPYEQIVKKYGFRSPAQASNVLVSARRMFQRILRALVGEYEIGEAQIDAEIADLQSVLSQAGAHPRQ